MVRTRIDLLRPLLKDPVPGVRTAAAEAIERLEAVGGFDEILSTLKSGDKGARIRAIYALGEIGGEPAVAPLLYCAKRPEEDIRSAAAAALGKLAVSSVLPTLIELLEDESPTVQSHAIIALRNFPATPGIRDKLRHFLNSSDGILEAEAAISLAMLKDLFSTEQIISLLSSHHASSRQAAATAFGLLPVQ